MNTQSKVGIVDRILSITVRQILSAIGRWIARIAFWFVFGGIAIGGMIWLPLNWQRATADPMILMVSIAWIVLGQFVARIGLREKHIGRWLETSIL